ncbi:phosphatase PAP2 family protein [Domibacillus aminovorans]|uniref:Phosphatidic acid phosphatase type 2/haloperoxidase domain-containing protein n=1 Tax=Domibacillus aminovorans TaxID=29332 RepID=A0A177KZ36_9BACI|nr:phosphatase PAP2 family protein [Domibacillus aminovorans]OAH58492.1 hypothetical protein AWH49_18775 [Domibacillus aminovorans]
MEQKKIKLYLITSFTILMLFMLSACSSEQTKNTETGQQKEPSINKGMGWTHENPVSPKAGDWKGLELKDGKSYKVDIPPANDSSVTKSEVEELKELTKNRTKEDEEFIRRWQNTASPNTLWFEITEELVQKYGLTGPEAARVHAIVSGAIYTGLTATFEGKYEYLRPRPTDLDPSITLPEGMKVPAHPSYPAGHTTTAWSAANILSYFFPHEKEHLEKIATDVANSRMKMGVHFRSDNEASKKLAKAVTTDVIESLKDDNAPLQYKEVKQGSSRH